MEMPTAVAKEDEDAVIRVTSYERKEVGFPFIRFDAPRFSFIREALRTPFASPPQADLGSMKNLPVEVLWQIFRPLSMASLIRLRQVNRRARQVVTAMKEYHIMMKYAIHVVLALDHVATWGYYTPTPADLYDAMRQDSCTRCGKFGGYVSIWWWDRVCSQCVQREPHVMGDGYNQLTPERLKRIDELFMLLAPLPHVKFDTKGQPPQVDHGIYCVGCYSAPENDMMRRHLGSRSVTDLQNCAYSRRGFLEHFRWCPESQALWEASQGGTVAVEVPEFVRKWRAESAALAE